MNLFDHWVVKSSAPFFTREDAFYAGMEVAAKLISNTSKSCKTKQHKAAERIRDEIKRDTDGTS